MRIVGLTLATVLGLALPSLAQQDNVLLLNARQTLPNGPAADRENRTCVVPRAWVNPDRLCPPDIFFDGGYSMHGRRILLDKTTGELLDEGFFIQGHRIELEVLNRKFLTDYSITIDGVTQLQNGPNIRNLNEAENLSLGPAVFATIPPSKGGTEGLTSRTAAQVLGQLIDEETSSQAQADLNNDHEVIQREYAKIQSQIEDFDQNYDLMLGTAPLPAADDNCAAVRGAPSVIPLQVCLDDEFFRESGGTWLAPPFRDEQEFRNINTRVEDLIAAVTTLGTELAGTDLPAKLRTLEAALAQYDNDVITFVGNIEAAKDAADLVLFAKNRFQEGLHRQEMRALLLNKLKGTDSKPTLDEAEMNALLESYGGPGSVGGRNATELQGLAGGFEQELLISKGSLDWLHGRLADFRSQLRVELPDALNDLNESQGTLLDRVNYIYDHSEVTDPLPKQIDLSGHSGNLLVYFTIRRIETFQRYVVVQVQGPGASPLPSATSNVMVLPPAAPAPAAAASAAPPSSGATPSATSSSTAPVTAAGTATPASPSNSSQNGLDNNPGVVVAKGVFQVHDFFQANVVAAIAFSMLKDQSITQQAQPLLCGGTATTPDPNCFSPLVASSRKWAPIVGLDYYLRPRDTYDRTDQPWLCRVHPAQCLGVMGAMSAVKGNDYFFGGFFEPALGVQFGVGANFGTHTVLQNPYKANVPVDISGGFPTLDQRGIGLYISAGMDLGIFRKVFGKFTGIGTSASSTSGQ